MSDDIFKIRGDKVTSYVIFTLANSCMPTLLKTKPSTLISFHKRYIENQYSFFQVLQKEADCFNCQLEVLFENETAFYIIVYTKELLSEVLNKHGENVLLKGSGYLEGNKFFYRNLENFKKRFQAFKVSKEAAFPHEVGIFLGYPIIDVEEYIKNNGENYMLCGYWKVYHNVEEAGRTFELFRKLRNDAVQLIFAGKELNEIILCA